VSLFNPWLWALLGVVLVIAEIAVSGYLLLGFGLGALAMAVILWLGAASLTALPAAGPVVLALFAGLSLLAWLVLSRSHKSPGRRADPERDINDFGQS
jgi:membrane protein implicated in regulation of membrane protease activity